MSSAPPPPPSSSSSSSGQGQKTKQSESDIWGGEEAATIDLQLAQLDTQQINNRTKMLEGNIR